MKSIFPLLLVSKVTVESAVVENDCPGATMTAFGTVASTVRGEGISALVKVQLFCAFTLSNPKRIKKRKVRSRESMESLSRDTHKK
jgi:hypothetical protein